MFQDRLELLRRGREVEQAITAGAALLVDFVEPFGERAITALVLELALMIKKRNRESFPDFLAHLLARKIFRGFLELVTKLLIRFWPAGEADHSCARRQLAVRRQIVKRGNEFAMRQI